MSEAVPYPTKVSRDGVALIKSFEGFRPQAVRRSDDRWVIGYGHTASAREGASVSPADAELLLQYDLIPVVAAIRDAVITKLNQHQFDALASFAFSVGIERFRVSDVLVLTNAGRMDQAAAAIIGWHDEAEAHMPPRRRSAERALFAAGPEASVSLADLLAQPLAPFPAVPDAVDAEVPDQDVAPFPAQDAASFDGQAPYVVGPDGPVSAGGQPAPSPVMNVGPGLALTETVATERLVLAPANDAEKAEAPSPAENRVVWDAAAEAQPSETEPTSPEPSVDPEQPVRRPTRRADPGSPWPFLILGAMGMVAFGAAMAAFRRAVHPGGGDTGLIGVALSVIAVACVAVAAWNLFQRWGRSGR